MQRTDTENPDAKSASSNSSSSSACPAADAESACGVDPLDLIGYDASAAPLLRCDDCDPCTDVCGRSTCFDNGVEGFSLLIDCFSLLAAAGICGAGDEEPLSLIHI